MYERRRDQPPQPSPVQPLPLSTVNGLLGPVTSLSAFIPTGWTILFHGANLHRAEWEGRVGQLDAPELTINDWGLSMLALPELLQQVTIGRSTIKSYYSGSGPTLELRMLALGEAFSARCTANPEHVDLFRRRFGDDAVMEMKAWANRIYWDNMQFGYHPMLPCNMELVRLGSVEQDSHRIVLYVPKQWQATWATSLADASL